MSPSQTTRFRLIGTLGTQIPGLWNSVRTLSHKLTQLQYIAIYAALILCVSLACAHSVYFNLKLENIAITYSEWVLTEK